MATGVFNGLRSHRNLDKKEPVSIWQQEGTGFYMTATLVFNELILIASKIDKSRMTRYVEKFRGNKLKKNTESKRLLK